MKNYLNQGRRVRQLERLDGMAKDAGDILKLVTVIDDSQGYDHGSEWKLHGG